MMQGMNPVLFCYDGSDDAKSALAGGAELFPGRPAVVLCIWEHGWSNLSVAWPDADTLQSLEDAAQENATQSAAEGMKVAADAGLTAEAATRLASGPVWQAILSVADEYDAAAIVLGRRGLGGVRSMLLGSVSNAVVHHSNRPVVIIPRA
jgi:nucleotide-binding universal stress UspA family protein